MGVRIKFHKGAWWIYINRDGRRRAKKIGDKETAKRVAQRIREQLAAGAFNLAPSATEEKLEKTNRAALKRISPASLPEVRPRELPPRTGLQVSLELQRRFFLVELDDDENPPRAMLGGVGRKAVVMRGKPRPWVGCDADVVLLRGRDTLQNVDESLGRPHTRLGAIEWPTGVSEIPGDSGSVSLKE